MAPLLYYAFPAFLALLALEALASRWLERRGGPRARGRRGFGARDTFASLAMGLGYTGISGVTKLGALAVYAGIHQYALLDLPNAAWVWALAIVGDDLCYYAFHRAHHEVRLLWAAHENHHSSRHFNLSTALRQSWTTPLTAPLFWAPLALLGVEPVMILTAQAISLLYQFWIHTELVGDLGPLEWVLNTPSHHRVHHGRNPRYLDRNHAGIFIVWDRLFGTFEPEDASEPVDYGLTTNIETHNPLRIAFHEWASMLRDAARARSWGDALGHLLRAPGWSPDGSTKTSEELRAAARAA